MTNQPINIRTASTADLPQLLQFEQGVIEAERPYAKTLREGPIHYYDLPRLMASENAELVVAQYNGELIGCGYARIDKSKPYLTHTLHAYLGFMYVDPNYRGRGVNKLIIQALMEWSRNKDVWEFILDVYEGNTAAIRAYEKMGFDKNMVEMRLGLSR